MSIYARRIELRVGKEEELHPRVGLDEGVLCCPELGESDGEDAQSKLCSIADGEEEADQESDLVQYSGKFKDEGHGQDECTKASCEKAVCAQNDDRDVEPEACIDRGYQAIPRAQEDAPW